ncbi:MAG TPA: hypothetical protein VFA77_00835 [Candidatus Eisenbacteria bacterium]|nr:hypothetical protein [Candidatus Eisenbacteria bacterium]
MNQDLPDPNRRDPWHSLRWPITLVVLTLLALIGLILFLRAGKEAMIGTIRETGKQAGKVMHAVGEGLEKFQKGTITQTFTAAIPKLSRNSGGNLELATANATETFKRSDKRTIAWDLIPLGETLSEIKVPVTYRYQLRLRDAWRLDVSNNTCIVYAPRIRAALPPAIHTDRMEKKSAQGWGRFNARQQMDELEQSITPTLINYAHDENHLSLVREACRKTVAEFVRDWLLKEEQWRTDRFHTIKVVFEDEQKMNLETFPPTLELKKD